MDGLQKDALFSLAEQYVENTSVSLFLTGKAGTGKTTFLRYIVEKTSKRCVVLAPTGVAAINARGSTIHSFFSLPLCPYLPDVPELKTEYQMPEQYRRLRKEKVKMIRTLELLVIDEISMVRADLMDAVDMTLRRYRRSSVPFGGVQLLMIGDAQQLSPVVTDAERPYLCRVYPSPYFFRSKALEKVPYVTIELQSIYRQADSDFIRILNGVRDVRLSPDMLGRLNARVGATAGENWIRLTTHNAQADRINQTRLEALPTSEHLFRAEITGDYPESLYPAAALLTLKEGMRVMFIRNDPDGHFFNGKLGSVRSIDPNGVKVVSDDGKELAVEPMEWQNLQYELDGETGEIIQRVLGSFRQLPLRPAWAITIHKSQGLTFDHVIIDAGSAFAFGQVYVALSRCRSLEGISLSTPILPSLLMADGEVSAFNARFPSPGEAERALDSYRRTYEQEQRCACFDFTELRRLVLVARKIWRESTLGTTYPSLAERVEAAAKEVIECEGIAARFRRQLDSLKEDVERCAERMGKASAYFLPRLEALPLRVVLAVEVDNAQIRRQLKNLVADLLPLWQSHIDVLHSIREEGFDLARIRQVRAQALIEEPSPSRKRKTSAQEARDIYNDNRHPEYVTKLIAWRRAKAAELGVPAFHVLHQKTLLAIADTLPGSRAALLDVPGFGPGLWEKYGLEILKQLSAPPAEKG